MNLVDFVTLLRNPADANDRFAADLPGIDADQIDVYLRSELDLGSEVKLFDAENIPSRLEIEISNIKYVNLFPLAMLREIVDDYLERDSKLESREIARRLIDYRINDA